MFSYCCILWQCFHPERTYLVAEGTEFSWSSRSPLRQYVCLSSFEPYQAQNLEGISQHHDQVESQSNVFHPHQLYQFYSNSTEKNEKMTMLRKFLEVAAHYLISHEYITYNCEVMNKLSSAPFRASFIWLCHHVKVCFSSFHSIHLAMMKDNKWWKVFTFVPSDKISKLKVLWDKMKVCKNIVLQAFTLTLDRQN